MPVSTESMMIQDGYELLPSKHIRLIWGEILDERFLTQVQRVNPASSDRIPHVMVCFEKDTCGYFSIPVFRIPLSLTNQMSLPSPEQRARWRRLAELNLEGTQHLPPSWNLMRGYI